METYEDKYKDLVKRLNKAREKKGAYTFNSVLDAVAPELKESEDEKIRKVLLNDFKNHCSEYYCESVNRDMVIAWLEKQGEQKPAWSEEDETVRNDIIAKLAILKSRAVDGGAEKEICEMEINWLKSLRPQSTWKPSDEQMDALRYVTNFDYGGYKAALVSLYEQLKKLKE